MTIMYKSSKRKMNNVFEDWEAKVLGKYKDWNRIDNEDEVILDRFTLIGFVQHEFNFDEMYPVAKLTNLCRRLLN